MRACSGPPQHLIRVVVLAVASGAFEVGYTYRDWWVVKAVLRDGGGGCHALREGGGNLCDLCLIFIRRVLYSVGKETAAAGSAVAVLTTVDDGYSGGTAAGSIPISNRIKPGPEGGVEMHHLHTTGAQFTCFTSCFTGTKVQILTQILEKEESKCITSLHKLRLCVCVWGGGAQQLASVFALLYQKSKHFCTSQHCLKSWKFGTAFCCLKSTAAPHLLSCVNIGRRSL